MMKKQIAGLVLAVSVVGGVGAGALASTLTDENPAPSSPSAPAAPDKLTIAPGAVGPVTVGMSKQEALATGFFVADVKSPADGCPARPLSWKDEYVNAFDIQTLGNGEIASIGIHGAGIVTKDGVGVGSTYAEVAKTYPDETLVEAGYGQSGIRVFDRDDGGWMGFLFEPAPDAIKGSDKVTFAEVTKGSEPSLMRDGC